MITLKNNPLCTRLLIALLLIFILFSSSCDAKENETIKIVIDQLEPMTFVDENGDFRGYAVELIQYIALTEGWDIEFTLLPWNECLETMKNGDADLLISVAYTNERDTYLDYTNLTFGHDWRTVFAQKDSGIVSIRDLEGKKIASLTDSYETLWITDQINIYGINCDIVLVDDFEEVRVLIEEKKVDAGMMSRYYVTHENYGKTFERTTIDTYPIPLYCATTEGKNEEIIATINSHLIELQADKESIYYKLEDKWFAVNTPNELPEWIKWMIGSTGFFLFLFIINSIVLKRTVHKRTAELVSKNEELGSAKNRYSSLVEESMDGIAIVQDGVIVFANSRFAEMLNYELDEVINTSAFNYVPKECAPMMAKLYEKRITNDPNIPSNYELELIRKDGSGLTVEMAVSITDNDGRAASMVIARDIEERKQAEKMREEKIRVEEANRTKSEFLANMSHELRTPLNAVIGFSEMLEMKTFGELSEKQQKYVDNIHSSGKHLLELINSILDLAKVESGKMELHMEKVDLTTICHEVVSATMPLAMKQDIELVYDATECTTAINADKMKLKQILLNLISNALKFTDSGGTVSINAHCAEDDVVVSVSDTGKGISKQDLKTVFDPFVQVGKFNSKETEGTGLGLALVKSFVELHGGRVWIESELGVGTTFYFEIPVNGEVLEKDDN